MHYLLPPFSVYSSRPTIKISCMISDDPTLEGHQETSARGVDLIPDFESVMDMNHSKCDLFSSGSGFDDLSSYSDYQRLHCDELSSLGAPLFKGQTLEAALEQLFWLLGGLIQNLHPLNSQSTLILFRSSSDAPEWTNGFVLRVLTTQIWNG